MLLSNKHMLIVKNRDIKVMDRYKLFFFFGV